MRWNFYGDISFYPRYNIAPSQEVPVIVRNQDGNELKRCVGLSALVVAQDASIGQRMINARAETLLERPSFK